MSSDEEYLDDLLKSIMENEDESDHVTEGEEEDTVSSDEEAYVNADEPEQSDELDFAIEDFGVEEPQEELEETPDSGVYDEETESRPQDDFVLNDFAIQEPDIDDIDLNYMNIDDDLEDDEPQDDDLHMKDFMTEKEEDSNGVEDSDGLLSEDEIEAMFAAADEASANEEEPADNGEDADIKEISGLLQADSSASVDDDMLALLESMSADMDEEITADSEEETAIPQEARELEPDDREARAEKGLFVRLFGGRKKDKEKQPLEEEQASDESEENRDFGEELNPAVQKVKRPNLFARLLTFLTETDDDEAGRIKAVHGMEPSDENRDILKELDAEDKKKKKKKVKGKKEVKEEDALDEEEEGSEASPTKKRKKKAKAGKAETPDIVIDTKPEKKVSKKNIIIIAGLGLTLTAMVVVICSVVPEFFEKSKARDAYYDSNYGKSYELLYGKKLDNSDTIIYNKSRIIMELSRKLDSYHNYMGMGKEVQALDALMSAVSNYPELLVEAQEYHVTQEVSAVYETILNILNDKYSLSEAVAKVISEYEDDLTYTRKLESIVYKTPFVMLEEEAEKTDAITDILPEEQRMMEEATGQSDGEETVNRIALENELPAGGERETGRTREETFAEDNAQTQAEVIQQETGLNGEEANVESAPETAPEEDVNQAEAAQETGNTGSQGQLIQGLRQPIDVEIHSN